MSATRPASRPACTSSPSRQWTAVTTPSRRRADRQLHLHRLEHDQRVALLDGRLAARHATTSRHRRRRPSARHRRRQRARGRRDRTRRRRDPTRRRRSAPRGDVAVPARPVVAAARTGDRTTISRGRRRVDAIAPRRSRVRSRSLASARHRSQSSARDRGLRAAPVQRVGVGAQCRRRLRAVARSRRRPSSRSERVPCSSRNPVSTSPARNVGCSSTRSRNGDVGADAEDRELRAAPRRAARCAASRVSAVAITLASIGS